MPAASSKRTFRVGLPDLTTRSSADEVSDRDSTLAGSVILQRAVTMRPIYRAEIFGVRPEELLEFAPEAQLLATQNALDNVSIAELTAQILFGV